MNRERDRANEVEERPAPGQTVRALVLAASRGSDDPMVKAFGVRHKCLLEVGGEPMLRRVVWALFEAPSVGEVCVVIDDVAAAREALGPLAADVRFLAPAESAAASVVRALKGEGSAGFVPTLVTTGDHALLDAEMVEAFLGGRRECPGTDLLLALARREVVERAYPDVKRTWLSFGDGQVTSCNLFLFATARALAAARFWQRAERDRKRPWRIALAFGIWPLLRLVLFRPGVREALRIAGERLGVVACPVFMTRPEAAIDVDKPEDLALAERILQSARAEQTLKA